MHLNGTKDLTQLLPAADAISCAFCLEDCACVDDTLWALPLQHAGVKRFCAHIVC